MFAFFDSDADVVAIDHLVVGFLVGFFFFLQVPLLDVETELSDEHVDLSGSEIATGNNMCLGIYKISPLQEGAYLITALIVLLGGHPVSLFDVHLLRPGPHLVHHVDVALLEVVSQLKLALH